MRRKPREDFPPNQLDPKAGQTTLQGKQASASQPPPRPRDIKSAAWWGRKLWEVEVRASPILSILPHYRTNKSDTFILCPFF